MGHRQLRRPFFTRGRFGGGGNGVIEQAGCLTSNWQVMKTTKILVSELMCETHHDHGLAIPGGDFEGIEVLC